MTDMTGLADEIVAAMFDAEPLLPVLLGIESDREGLGDPSEAAEQEYRARLAALVERARRLSPAPGTADAVTRDVLISQAQGHIDRIDSRLIEFTVSDIFVSPAPGLLTLLPMVAIGDAEQARAHLGRLAAIPDYLAKALQRHRAGIAAGRTPVEHLVRAAIAHLDRYLAAPGSDPLLRQPAPDEDFERSRARLLAEVVRPGFAAYRDGLVAEVLPHGRPAHRPGLTWLPGGDESYSAQVRLHTTTERTPEELHAIGRALIENLAGEYAELGERVFGTDELAEIFERLRSDPALRWNSGDELLEHARAAIARAARAAPRWFGRVPTQECVVEPVPAAEAPGGPAAYYLWPAADGSRPGTYFANTHEAEQRFRHTAEVTAFHEAIPGHHLQLGIALGLEELPLLRRIGEFNAYAEGWGLYAERLAEEMGLYSDDISLLGMLTMDSMRAGRLVVDTGLHAKGWSRQRAVDFLAENTPIAPVEIESEVDRYIAYPGQALSYMVGRLEIQRVRVTAENLLGDRFDIREFHDVVLGGGALPLSVLESVVTDWIVRKGGAA
jgi:uncharacterized protein (DUF885 family)